MENVHAVVANAFNNLTKVEFKKDVGIVVVQYKNDFIVSNSVTLYNFGVVSHIKWEGEEFLQQDFKISYEEYVTFYQAVVNSLLVEQSKQEEIDKLISQINEALDAFEDGEFNHCHKTLMKALGDKE